MDAGEMAEEDLQRILESGRAIDGALEKMIVSTVSQAIDESLEHHDREGWLVRNPDLVEDWALVSVIALIVVFLGPVLLIALVLFFIYKRKKSRDAVVMEALRNGRDIPSGYGSSSGSQSSGAAANHSYTAPADTTAASSKPAQSNSLFKGKFADIPLMHNGIRKVALGLGVVVVGISISLSLLIGIGWAICLYGIGQIAIGYLSSENENKQPAPESKYTRDEPKAEASAEETNTEEEKNNTTTTDVTETNNEKPE